MIIYIYGPSLLGTGGMESVIRLLTNELTQRGHDCKLLLSHLDGRGKEDWLNDVPQYILCNEYSKSSDDNFHSDINHIINLQNTLTELATPDIIITMTPKTTLIANIASKMMKPKPIILSQPHFSLHEGALYTSESSSFSYADGHLAISRGVQEQLKALDASKPVSLIYNPIENTDGFLINRPHKPVFAYVGRIFNKQKRLDVLFKALSKIKDEEWSIKIIGDDLTDIYRKDADFLKDYSKKLGINQKIQWLGHHEDPWEVLNEATVLLLTSDYEGFGMVLAEALARGLPVISTKCPKGPEDIVNDHENGWLVNVGDVDELSNLLLKIISNDIELPNKETCIESVKQFSKTQVVDNLESILYKHLNNSSRTYKVGEGEID